MYGTREGRSIGLAVRLMNRAFRFASIDRTAVRTPGVSFLKLYNGSRQQFDKGQDVHTSDVDSTANDSVDAIPTTAFNADGWLVGV